MDFDKLFPNRFLKAGLFDGKDCTLTIAKVELAELEGEDNKKEIRALVHFSERGDRQLVLNKTNAICLKQMFGRESNAWVGKRVTLYPATIFDSFTKENILAIRVRGSPDIPADIAFKARIGRKMQNLKVIKTAGRSAPAVAAPKHQPQGPTTPAPAGEPPPMSEEELAAIAASETAQAREPGAEG